MKVVLTGGAGHIGSSLVRHLNLNSRIEEVLIVDSIRNNFLTPLMSRKKSPNTKLIINSIENLSNTEINKFKHFDCIVHLAAETDVSKTSGLLADFLSLNLTPTRKIIEIARLHGIPIIFPSSTSVYDRSGFELTESSFIQQPYTPYAQCKLLEEKELNAFFNSGGTGAILRLGTIHGFSAGMKFHTAVNKMVLQAASKKTITVWRTALNQLRPYLSLIDLNNAISLILESRKFTGDTYNLATSHLTVSELLQTIESVIGHSIQKEFVDSVFMNEMSFTVSTSKIRQLGLTFRGSLKDDIAEITSRLGIFNGD